MAKWRVSLFAYHRERHGDSVVVAAEPNSKAILAAIAEAGIGVSSCRLAVNDEFVANDEPVAIGSEVALIPPVSGG